MPTSRASTIFVFRRSILCRSLRRTSKGLLYRRLDILLIQRLTSLYIGWPEQQQVFMVAVAPSDRRRNQLARHHASFGCSGRCLVLYPRQQLAQDPPMHRWLANDAAATISLGAARLEL